MHGVGALREDGAQRACEEGVRTRRAEEAKCEGEVMQQRLEAVRSLALAVAVPRPCLRQSAPHLVRRSEGAELSAKSATVVLLEAAPSLPRAFRRLGRVSTAQSACQPQVPRQEPLWQHACEQPHHHQLDR